MKRNTSVSSKCCATCIYWAGNVKYNAGIFGSKVEFDDAEKAKCNKKTGWSTKTCKGTDGGGLIFSCSDWKQRY